MFVEFPDSPGAPSPIVFVHIYQFLAQISEIMINIPPSSIVRIIDSIN